MSPRWRARKVTSGLCRQSRWQAPVRGGRRLKGTRRRSLRVYRSSSAPIIPPLSRCLPSRARIPMPSSATSRCGASRCPAGGPGQHKHWPVPRRRSPCLTAPLTARPLGVGAAGEEACQRNPRDHQGWRLRALQALVGSHARRYTVGADGTVATAAKPLSFLRMSLSENRCPLFRDMRNPWRRT